MDIYKLKWTALKQAIFRLFCVKAGKALNQREIAKLLKVSPTAVGKALKSLKKEEIVKKEKRGRMNLILIELNRDNKKVIGLKRAENLKMLYESGLVEFLEENLPTSTIILFGSYSQGYDTITSDIDIAIIGMKEKIVNLNNFQKVLEREIKLNFYNSISEIHKNLRENILNGIVIMGGISL